MKTEKEQTAALGRKLQSKSLELEKAYTLIDELKAEIIVLRDRLEQRGES